MRNLAPVLAATALLLPGLALSAHAEDEGKAWLGIAIICSSGLFLSLRELHASRRTPESVDL